MAFIKTTSPTREARKLLGLMDDNFDVIPLQKMSKEALIVRIEIQSVRIFATNIGHKATVDNLVATLKSAKQAKALANRRADEAATDLKKVRAALKGIGMLTEKLTPED